MRGRANPNLFTSKSQRIQTKLDTMQEKRAKLDANIQKVRDELAVANRERDESPKFKVSRSDLELLNRIKGQNG